MINAFVKSGESDPKGQQELEVQLAASKAKEQLFIKAKNRYAQLHVVQVDDTEALISNGVSSLFPLLTFC
jgi:hypothetical protein